MNEIIKMSVIICFASILMSASCSKSTETPTPATSNALKDNTWKVNDKLFVGSQYGKGWASSDFSPAFSLTDATTNPKGTQMITIIFLEKPKSSGKYTVEEFSDIKLNAVRTNKISGSKVAIEVIDNSGNITNYISKTGNGGVVDVSVANGKFKANFTDITLINSNVSTQKAIVSGVIIE
jgi:hypothetical protein